MIHSIRRLMTFGLIIKWMDCDIRKAIAAKTIEAALGAPLFAGFEFAESEQERIKIKDALWPKRVAGHSATRQCE